jgi:hypothetical protein
LLVKETKNAKEFKVRNFIEEVIKWRPPGRRK